MKQKILTTLFPLLGLWGASTATHAQEGFVVKGQLNLPDGYDVEICCETDTSSSVEVAAGKIKDGHFILTGKVGKPQSGTFMTNNMQLVSDNKWPIDSIRWTYTDIFMSDNEI